MGSAARPVHACGALGAASAALLAFAACAEGGAPAAPERAPESSSAEAREAAFEAEVDVPPRRAGATSAGRTVRRQGPWRLPEPGACTPSSGLEGEPGGDEDVGPLPVRPGEEVTFERLELLERYLPAFIWRHRERFFYEGMRLRVGPCFRDYGPPAFYRAATRRFAGEARLLENGGLASYSAGIPFPPAELDPEDPRAGLKWLWNVEHRYQGAGFRGRFRMTDLVGRAEPFLGEIFKLLLGHRADRPESGYRAAHGEGQHFVAGGVFHEPFAAREFAWRQFRDVEHQREPRRSDDLHSYLPEWRRVRRLNASRVQGLFMPSFSVGVQSSRQLAAGAGGAASGGGGAGVSGAGGTGAPSGAPSRRSGAASRASSSARSSGKGRSQGSTTSSRR